MARRKKPIDDEDPLPGLDATLQECKDWLRRHHVRGVECPSCGQFVKKYRRPINASWARSLIWMTRQGDRWIDVPKEAPRYVLSSREFAKLVHWDMIEERPNDDKKKRTSGQWRVRPVGFAFARGEIVVPPAVWLYNNTFQGFCTKPQVSIRDVLKKKFDYEALMRGEDGDRKAA